MSELYARQDYPAPVVETRVIDQKMTKVRGVRSALVIAIGRRCERGAFKRRKCLIKKEDVIKLPMLN